MRAFGLGENTAAMTHRSNYPGPVEGAGGQPAGDDDPLAELARIVGNNVSAHQFGSLEERQAFEGPQGDGEEHASVSHAEGELPSQGAESGARATDAFAALDAVFSSSGGHDPFAELNEVALSVKGEPERVDFVSDLPPVPKLHKSPQPTQPENEVPAPQPTLSSANLGAPVGESVPDDLSRDLEASLVASLDQTQVERDHAARPAQPVSRAIPAVEGNSPVMSRATSSLRERLGRTTPAPVRREPQAPSGETQSAHTLTQPDYDSWRAERAVQQARVAAASAVAASSAGGAVGAKSQVQDPVLRGTYDEVPDADPVFEPDLAAFAAETHGDHINPASEIPTESSQVSSKHLEDALLAEFHLDGPAEDAAPAISVEAVDHHYAPSAEKESVLEHEVEDIFADVIAREPEAGPTAAKPLDPELAAELQEIEAMSAGFEKVAEEIDPFAGEEDEAWQLEEAVANDSSLDDMSWPAAAEKLAQTEAAHQAAIQAKRPDGDKTTPPPGGYDLDAVAQAMRQKDPSLDGGVLPQAVPRPTVPLPHEEGVVSSGVMRKGLFAAVSLAAVVVAGGIGLTFIDFGGASKDGTPPPLIRADVSPMKEVPAPSDQPSNEQTKIFSPEEATNTASSEERLLPRDDTQVDPLPPAPQTATTDNNGVFEVNRPKRVRTVIVRPDGSIVEREAGGQPTASVRPQAPRVVSTTPVRIPAQQPVGNSGQWDSLPGEQLTTSQQASGGFGGSSPQADPFASQQADANSRVSLAGVTAVPASKPFVSGAIPAQTAVRVVNVAQQPAIRQPSAPLDLTGGSTPAFAQTGNRQVAAAGPQAVAPTPTPSEGVVGDIPTGTYIVQVASVRSIDDARGQIRSYNRRYPNLMALVTPVITRADLGDKGIYYRIQVPFDGPTSANTFCTEFKTAGGDCYVRRN